LDGLEDAAKFAARPAFELIGSRKVPHEGWGRTTMSPATSSEALFGPGELVAATHPSYREAPPVRRIRGHVVVGLQEALRARGHFERYRDRLTAIGRSDLLEVSPTEWLAVEHVVVNDSALRSLELDDWELRELGLAIADRSYGVVLSTLMRLSAHVGLDVSRMLQQFPRVHPKLLDGGGQGVFRVSPRVVRWEMWNHPLAGSPVNRTVTRGSVLSTFQKLNPSTTVSEAGVTDDPPSFALRIQY